MSWFTMLTIGLFIWHVYFFLTIYLRLWSGGTWCYRGVLPFTSLFTRIDFIFVWLGIHVIITRCTVKTWKEVWLWETLGSSQLLRQAFCRDRKVIYVWLNLLCFFSFSSWKETLFYWLLSLWLWVCANDDFSGREKQTNKQNENDYDVNGCMSRNSLKVFRNLLILPCSFSSCSH